MPRIKRNRSDVLASGNYYPLRKDFIKVLGLLGTAAILFTVIYSYSLNDDLQGSFYGSRKQLAEEVGVSVSSCTKYLKQLVDDSLVEKNLYSRTDNGCLHIVLIPRKRSFLLMKKSKKIF